jgi:hypothetical protein
MPARYDDEPSLQRLQRSRPARCGRPLGAVPLVKLPSATESSRDEKYRLIVSPDPPCAWLPSVLRRPRPALRGFPSASLDRRCDPPAILSCGSAFFRVPSGSPCPPPRAPLLGSLTPEPPRIFSAAFGNLRRPATSRARS